MQARWWFIFQKRLINKDKYFAVSPIAEKYLISIAPQKIYFAEIIFSLFFYIY